MSLKLIAQSKLDYARRRDVGELAKGGGVGQVEAGSRKVYVVKSVEGFGANLDTMTFKGQGEEFAERQVEVRHRGTSDNAAGAGCTGVLLHEGRRSCVRGAE